MTQKTESFFAVTQTYFERIVHYQTSRNNTVWMKLHFDFLDDEEFCSLEDHTKAHLILLMILALKLNNKVPLNMHFLKIKLAATTEIDIEILLKTKFFERVKSKRIKSIVASKKLAACKQIASPDTQGVEGECLSNDKHTDNLALNANETLQCVCRLVKAKNVCSDKLLQQQHALSYQSVTCLPALRLVITKLRSDKLLNSIKTINAYINTCFRDGRENYRVKEILEKTEKSKIREMLENISEISALVENEISELTKNEDPRLSRKTHAQRRAIFEKRYKSNQKGEN